MLQELTCPSSACCCLQASHTSLRVIDVSAEAVDAATAAVESDRRIAEAFLREPWPLLADFLHREGTSTLLEFIQHTPGERSTSFSTLVNPLRQHRWHLLLYGGARGLNKIGT